MRVAVVHGRFDQPGGAERYLTELATACAEAGHTLTVHSTTPAPPGPWQAELLPLPGPAQLWADPSPAGKAYRHLADAWPWRTHPARQVLRSRPDVVHLHNWQHLGAGIVHALTAEVPVLHTVHDFALADPTTTLETGDWSRARTAALQLRSRVLAERFGRVRLHWPAERTRRIAEQAAPALARLSGTVLPLASASTAGLGELPRGEDATFLYLGMLSEHKGVADLLAAWAAARDRLPWQARLLVAGDGPLRAQVEAAATADHGVRALGYLDPAAKRQALAMAQWLVFPSRWHENFSISCVEALAAGRPLLTSEVARPPMASDGSVVVAAGGDPAGGRVVGLADALVRCATMDGLTYRRYAAGAAGDGRLLDWPVHVEAMTALLARTAGGVGDG